MNNSVYVYVFDTMADWEIGYITAELNSGRFFKKGVAPCKVVTVGAAKAPITTMGGLRIFPDITTDECDIKKADALILAGGNTWMDAIHKPIIDFAKKCLNENTIVAAICGATAALAQNGMLDSAWHTSNDLSFLKMVCKDYTGEKYYKYEPAVTDGKLITATGAAPLDFAQHILNALDVFLPEALELWYKQYKTLDAKDYYGLMSLVR